MAHSNNSAITGRFSGSINKELVFRDWDGKTVVAKSPKRGKGTVNPALLQARQKFLVASHYAKAVMSNTDQSIADAYGMALKPRQNLFSRAIQDFLNPPEVIFINKEDYNGAAGDPILVRAFDDFRVTALRVEIYSATGALLESGAAVQQLGGLDWKYTAVQANAALAGTKIKAIATDVPGNKGSLEITL